MICNYKETREAYTILLEKIVDVSLRMGLELDKRQQSALAMLLDGVASIPLMLCHTMHV